MIIRLHLSAVKCNFSDCYKNSEGEKTLNLFDAIEQVYLLPSKTFFQTNYLLSNFYQRTAVLTAITLCFIKFPCLE